MATAVRTRNSRYQSGRKIGYDAYDGSAARVLEREEVLQPKPRVRTKERVVARPKAMVREAGKVSPFAIVGFLAVGVFATILIMTYAQLTVLSEEVVTMKTELSALQSEEARLRTQYELVYDLRSIEETMMADGAMVKPSDSQIMYVDLSADDRITYFQGEETTTGVEGIWTGITTACGNAVEYFR